MPNKESESEISLNIILAITALISLIFSIFSAMKVWPLSEAKLVLVNNAGLSNSITCDVVLNYENKQPKDLAFYIEKNREYLNNICGHQIVPIIKNIGKSNALDVNFEIYSVPFIRQTATSTFSFTVFNQHNIINDILPEQEVEFGSYYLYHSFSIGENKYHIKQITNDNDDNNDNNSPFALIYFINYKDAFNQKGNNKNIILMYKYHISFTEEAHISSLMGSDYNSFIKNKFHTFLKNEIAKNDTTKDFKQELLDELEKKGL